VGLQRPAGAIGSRLSAPYVRARGRERVSESAAGLTIGLNAFFLLALCFNQRAGLPWSAGLRTRLRLSPCHGMRVRTRGAAGDTIVASAFNYMAGFAFADRDQVGDDHDVQRLAPLL
jgi:hypothetical protein